VTLRGLALVGVATLLAPGRAAADGEQCVTAPARTPVVRPAESRAPAARAPTPNRCLAGLGDACLRPKPLCAHDLELAKIAWKYYEVNYQPKTGLVNSVDGYPSTTLWDSGSALGATIAAHQLGLITAKDFDDRITSLLATLNTLPLYRNEVPNKAYHTVTAKMVDYANKESPDGIGYSAIDLSRMVTFLDLLGCLYPRHKTAAQRVLHRWSFCRIIAGGQMFGAAFDRAAVQESLNQEGRLGYEQYAALGWKRLGFDVHESATYRNASTQTIKIDNVAIAYDVRDPRKFGAYNYVVTESYALEGLEYGRSAESAPLLRAIYEVQKRRYTRTGIVTAVSEDNVDRDPWFVYNTIFAAGTPWNTITDTGRDMSALKTTSVKAAFALAVLFPDDDYSKVLFDKIATAYDPAKGWYSGIYENGSGLNKAITANTNGIVLEALLYKVYGPVARICDSCGHDPELRLLDNESPSVARDQCFPHVGCDACRQGQVASRLKPLPQRSPPPAPSAVKTPTLPAAPQAKPPAPQAKPPAPQVKPPAPFPTKSAQAPVAGPP